MCIKVYEIVIIKETNRGHVILLSYDRRIKKS